MRRKLPPKPASHVEALAPDEPATTIPNAPQIPDFLQEQATPEQLGLIYAMLDYDLESGTPWPSQPLQKRYAAIEQATGKRGERGVVTYPIDVTREQGREQFPILCDQLRDELQVQAARIVETIRAHGFDPEELTYKRFPCYFNHNSMQRQDFPVIDLTGWLGEALSYCLPEPAKEEKRGR